MKNKNINKNIRILIFLALIFGASIFLYSNKTRAVQSADCDQLSGNDEAACEALEKKAKAYQELIDIKNKQQSTLQKQMELIDTEQARTQTEFQKIQKDVAEFSKKTESIQDEIKYKENLIAYQKVLLAKLLQSYYEYYQDGVLKFVLVDNDFSNTFNQADRIKQISTNATEILKEIQKTKAELSAEHADVQERKIASEELKATLEDKKGDLQATESQKQSLLSQTKGEEEKYKNLLARVEAQKLELMNFGSAENIASVSASVNNYPKPKDNLASTNWYFNQTDSRWGKKTIGNSNSTMEDYGCAISAVAMVFKYYGAGTNPGSMAKEKIFYYDLIKWPGSWSSGVKLVSSTGHGNLNWKTIDSEIAAKHPVIVYIGKTSGGGGHYVVIHGKDNKDYIVHDPYFGANLYLGTSRALVGALGRNTGTRMDQMIIYK